MVCIYCGGPTQVINSRHQKKPNNVWRRRKCTVCEAIFTTRENVDTAQALQVHNHKTYQPFSRDTLLLSIYDSLKHRKTAVADATALTDTVWGKLLPQIQDATIERDDVTKTTHEILKRFDKAAATHYQAFHPVKG